MQAEKVPGVVEVTSTLSKSFPRIIHRDLADICYTAAPSGTAGSDKEERWLVRKLGKIDAESSIKVISVLTWRFLRHFHYGM